MSDASTVSGWLSALTNLPKEYFFGVLVLVGFIYIFQRKTTIGDGNEGGGRQEANSLFNFGGSRTQTQYKPAPKRK
jgi:hypothetical protein